VDTLHVHAPLRHQTGEVAPGAWCRVEVRDTGHGMSAEVREKAFEPFFTTKPRGRGSGLGLSTAFGIVRQAGGHLVVAESGEDGTAIHVYLPLAMGATVPGADGGGTPPSRPSAAPERVLVVDDEAQVRDVVRRLLQRMGHDVLVAAEGEEALGHLRAGRFTLLVTDLLMPGMSGTELARRALAIDAGLRVIYISGFTDEQVGLDGSGGPRERFLAKPFTAAELAQAIEDSR
jgi:CheY-like chemotaxis protein